MLFIAQNYSYRWWGCHVAGAGDMEERQPALHRLVSLWKLLCLWKVQRYKSLPQSSSRAIFKAWLRIYPYLLKCFCPVFTIQHIPLSLFHRQCFPASFVSRYSVYLQLILYSDDFEWKLSEIVSVPDTQSWQMGTSMSLQWALRRTNSQLVKFVGRQSWRCSEGWGPGDTHSDCWFRLDHLNKPFEQNSAWTNK